MIHKSLVAAAMLATSALVPASAMAASVFDFTDTGSNSSNNYGNVRTFTGSDGTKVEASAYSLNNNSLTTSYLGQYLGWGTNQYGLGVVNSGNDNDHAIDNSGWTDFVILQFDKVVSVSSLGLYGFGDDTDVMWAAGTTATSFAGTLSFNSYNALDQAFGDFSTSGGDDLSGYANRSVNGGALTGNLFLVAAASNSRGNDSFKLSSLTANVAAVPEPATWAMMMMGLGLAGAMMRRSKANTAVSFA